MTSIPMQPSTTQVSILIPVKAISFTQLVEKATVQQATANVNIAAGGTGGASQDPSFQGLMPTWMLDAGSTIENQQKFDGPSGQLGQFMQAAAQIAALEKAFTETVGQLQSFNALKDWLNTSTTDASPSQVSTYEDMLKGALNSFKPNGNSTQIDQEESSEYGIACEVCDKAQNQASSVLLSCQGMQTQAGDLLSGQTSLEEFMSQMSQELFQGMSATQQ